MSIRNKGLFIVGLIVTLVLAGLVSGYASSAPDGLEKSATDSGIPIGQEEPAADSPLADYRMPGVDNPRLATGLAGAAGAALTLGVGGGLYLLVRRRSPASRRDGAPR
jgi:hypothetical protein